MASATETEIKLRVKNDGSEMQDKLKAAGYRVSQPREFEANTLYDTEDSRLFHSGMLLRVRESGGRSVLTWKGPAIPGPHKSRPERETGVNSAETLGYILDQLGFKRVFRYEKFRTELKGANPEATVTFDETPIGIFIELEGPPSWIDQTAAMLGFKEAEYVTESYGTLYRQWCESNEVKPSDMVFSSR
jgi:adenylate cyclase class 2